MAHTHEFDSPNCGAHLDSRRELDQHNAEYHAGSSQDRSASSNPDTSRRDASSSPSDDRR